MNAVVKPNKDVPMPAVNPNAFYATLDDNDLKKIRTVERRALLDRYCGIAASPLPAKAAEIAQFISTLEPGEVAHIAQDQQGFSDLMGKCIDFKNP